MDHSIKILIAEDEALIALYLKHLVLRAGYELTGIAVTGEEAMQCADAAPPDLALMDVNLVGDMDGIEVAEYLYVKYNIPAIYLSAYTPDEVRKRTNPEIPFHYLPKFSHEHDVLTAIEDTLAEEGR